MTSEAESAITAEYGRVLKLSGECACNDVGGCSYCVYLYTKLTDMIEAAQ